MHTINNLNPELVWSYFSDILEIPRPSKKEEKILAYLKDFAKNHKLVLKQDKTGNILIRKPASGGYEGIKTVVLQSHVDMVCEKNEDSQHNFEVDPIETFIEDGWIKANGTTLGADNGIGVAIQLAILADKNIEHGQLECLFTVDEESGMTGAFGLEDDFFTGNLLINLDSEDEGEIFIGCAGGMDTLVSFPVKYNSIQGKHNYLSIQVKGLSGGHSGDDINKGRGNAIKILVGVLRDISKQVDFKLCTMKGGNLRNAIPRESKAIIAITPEKEKELLSSLKQNKNSIREEFAQEPNLSIEIDTVNPVGICLTGASQQTLLNCLFLCPNGVIEMSKEIPDLVETSTNLASINALGTKEFEIVTSQRSSIESSKQAIASQIGSVFKTAGAKVRHTDSYPGWNPNTDSEILRIAESTYKKLFKTNPIIKAIHAGLECGLFLEKNPDLDMVSIGPTIKGAHSPDERIEIESVEKFWKFILDILQSIPEETY